MNNNLVQRQNKGKQQQQQQQSTNLHLPLTFLFLVHVLQWHLLSFDAPWHGHDFHVGLLPTLWQPIF